MRIARFSGSHLSKRPFHQIIKLLRHFSGGIGRLKNKRESKCPIPVSNVLFLKWGIKHFALKINKRVKWTLSPRFHVCYVLSPEPEDISF